MTTTRTPTNTTRAGVAYSLPEEQRQAILSTTDSTRLRQKIHAQRENFRAKNNGFEFGEQTKSQSDSRPLSIP